MELIHGGDWAGQKKRLGNKKIRDFSANVSPLGVPEGVREAICRAAEKADRYPDPLCRELTQKLSEKLSCPAEWIVCGNGAADLIYRLLQAKKSQRVLLTAPAFAEYEQAARLAGSEICFYELKEEKDFRIQEDILEQITPDVDLVFLCEPNNPTGQCTEHGLLTAILERCRECSTLLALDECFLEFLPDRNERTLLPYLGQYPNLVILRAFTKLYAMAGVRLGYCVCSDPVLKEQLLESGQPWSVSLLAQEAGIAALLEDAYADRVREMVEKQRPVLVNGLRQAGFQVWEGKANYLLFRSQDATLGKRMEEAGFPIRDCSNYHNLQPGDYRIAVRTEEENRAFLEALFRIVGKEWG